MPKKMSVFLLSVVFCHLSVKSEVDSMRHIEKTLENYFDVPTFTTPKSCLSHPFHTAITDLVANGMSEELRQNGITKSSLLWPKCKMYKPCKVCPKNERQFKDAYFWINYYIKHARRYLENQNVITYEDKKTGNHLIAGYGEINGDYFQFIDGKTLTLLLQADVELKDTVEAKKIIMQKLYSCTDLSKLYCGPALKHTIIIKNRTDKELSGKIKTTLNCSGYVQQFRNNYVWTNGEVIIVDIFKVRTPHLLMYSHPPEEILGSLPVEYSKPFVRFSDSSNVDFKNEIYNFFPALKDSLYEWLEQSEDHFPIGFENTPKPIDDE